MKKRFNIMVALLLILTLTNVIQLVFNYKNLKEIGNSYRTITHEVDKYLDTVHLIYSEKTNEDIDEIIFGILDTLQSIAYINNNIEMQFKIKELRLDIVGYRAYETNQNDEELLGIIEEGIKELRDTYNLTDVWYDYIKKYH